MLLSLHIHAEVVTYLQFQHAENPSLLRDSGQLLSNNYVCHFLIIMITQITQKAPINSLHILECLAE